MHKMALVGAAGYTAFKAVSLLTQTISGSDTVYERVNHWNQAQNLKNPILALGKRAQVLTGSDSFVCRLSNFSKAIAYTVCVVLFIDVYNQLERSSMQQTATIDLLNNVTSLQTQADKCSRNLTISSKTLTNLQKNFDQIQNELNDCSTIKDGFKRFSDDCNQRMVDLNEQFKLLQAKANDKLALQKLLETCNRERTTCQGDTEEKSNQISELSARIETAEQGGRTLQASAQAVQQQLTTCLDQSAQKEAEVQKQQDHLEQCIQKKTACTGETAIKTTQIQELSDRIRTTEKQLADCLNTPAKAPQDPPKKPLLESTGKQGQHGVPEQ